MIIIDVTGLFEDKFPSGRSLGCKILLLYSFFLLLIASFYVLKLWHMYAHSHPQKCLKLTHKPPQNNQILLKKCTFEA